GGGGAVSILMRNSAQFPSYRIAGSTFTNNGAPHGTALDVTTGTGPIANDPAGILYLDNSTMTGNGETTSYDPACRGAAIHVALHHGTTLELAASTVTANVGGGIFLDYQSGTTFPQVQVFDSILAGNLNSTGSTAASRDCMFGQSET